MGNEAWLKQARKEAGVSLAEGAYRLRQLLPSVMCVSYETIRRIERGKTGVDPVLAAALGLAYGKQPDEFPEGLATQLQQVRELLDDDGKGDRPWSCMDDAGVIAA